MSLNQTVFEILFSFTGNPVLDSIMYLLAEGLVLFVPIFLIFLWFEGREGKDDGSFAFVATILGIASTYFLGLFYAHENPSAFYDTVISYHPENSFPSQHTTTVLTVSLAMLYRERKAMGWSLMAATLLTGFSRVYIGEHWPVDIVGALPAGLTGLGITYLVWDYLDPIKSRVYSISDKIETRLEEEIR